MINRKAVINGFCWEFCRANLDILKALLKEDKFYVKGNKRAIEAMELHEQTPLGEMVLEHLQSNMKYRVQIGRLEKLQEFIDAAEEYLARLLAQPKRKPKT